MKSNEELRIEAIAKNLDEISKDADIVVPKTTKDEESGVIHETNEDDNFLYFPVIYVNNIDGSESRIKRTYYNNHDELSLTVITKNGNYLLIPIATIEQFEYFYTYDLD